MKTGGIHIISKDAKITSSFQIKMEIPSTRITIERTRYLKIPPEIVEAVEKINPSGLPQYFICELRDDERDGWEIVFKQIR